MEDGGQQGVWVFDVLRAHGGDFSFGESEDLKIKFRVVRLDQGKTRTWTKTRGWRRRSLKKISWRRRIWTRREISFIRPPLTKDSLYPPQVCFFLSFFTYVPYFQIIWLPCCWERWMTGWLLGTFSFYSYDCFNFEKYPAIT